MDLTHRKKENFTPSLSWFISSFKPMIYKIYHSLKKVKHTINNSKNPNSNNIKRHAPELGRRIAPRHCSLDKIDIPFCPALTNETLNNFHQVLFKVLKTSTNKISFVTQLVQDIRKKIKLKKIKDVSRSQLLEIGQRVFTNRELIRTRLFA